MTISKRKRRSAGDGGISPYQTKSGERFLIKYRVPAPDGIGTKQVLRRGYTSQKAAAAALREALVEVGKGTYVAPTKLTLGEYLTETWLPALRLKPSTEASYRKNVRLHVVPHIGGVALAGLTGQRLTALYRKLESEGRVDGAGGLSARTVRYIHTIVHRALRDAVDDGLLAANPADKAKPPTNAQAKSPELRYWTAAQLAAFLQWARRDEDELFPAWQLLAMTGMRRGEALGLRWSDLDVTAARVAIRRSAVLVKHHGEGETIEIGPPKNGRARVVDVDPRTVAVLRTHRASLAELDLRLARDEALVLPSRNGDVRHPERFSRSFAASIARAGKALGDQAPPAIRLHDLRHTHATILLLAGEHPKVVQERLGHATISITLDVYSHVIPTMQREAAARFAEAVYGS
ncbi:site-specific integrase [Pseudonocardia halophobica]|uniref:Site-specific integrase n=1 Tax=Pseudonocardia halophobica TaxID=29401 RepID=A0A9W6L5L5_9PSEU|nr:site-specific integrase [Pseudonocardia halophobica]GLL13380.1 site-specific integrase [Pseudonocardia halophobica]